MARPKGKRASKSSAGGSAKRRRQEEDLLPDADDADMFQASDEEAGADAEDGYSSDESAEETAEQKKLRLAKAYLAQLREAEAAEGSGSEDETTHDAVAQRLRGDALEAMGQLQRHIADRIVLPPLGEGADDAHPSTDSRLSKCHRHSVTALALTADDTTAYSVSKDGRIVQMDVESGVCTRFQDSTAAIGHMTETGTTADWVAKAAQRGGGVGALLSAAISSDGQYLAVGGGDRKVHVWDTRSRQYIQGFSHHRDIVTGLAFREDTHVLYSGSFDRTVKIWSLDDRAYVDTLYGHQSEVLAVDALRAERVLTSGQDHTCRLWKVPEESQLIFRGYGQAIDCVSYVTGTEWVSGSSDGGLALWSQLKKKPVHVVRGAHPPTPNSAGAGGVGGDATSWVSAVASCRGSDLVASGAGDGMLRLWAVQGERPGAGRTLKPLGGLPARGFVNALQIARSGRFVLAGMGQEPRLGRWARDKKARNGLLLHRLTLRDE